MRVEHGQKRVRAFVGGEVVVDSTAPLLVWESPHYPQYYLPRADVRAALIQTGTTKHSPSRGDAIHFTVKAGGKELVDAAWQYPRVAARGAARPRPVRLGRRGRLVRGGRGGHRPSAEPVHARRHPAQLPPRAGLIDGEVVADTHRPWLLFETGLPVRYYLPKVDVRMDLLEPTDTHTATARTRATASYWTAVIDGKRHEDVVWTYPYPLAESLRVGGLVSFYDTKATVEVDGVPVALIQA